MIESAEIYTKQKEAKLGLASVISETIKPDRVFYFLQKLQSPAPSGTVLYTRTPVIEELLKEIGIDSANFTSRIFGTRSPAVLLGRGTHLWFSAHSDQPTYRPPVTNETTFDIMPICAHRPVRPDAEQSYPEFPAAVMRYLPAHNKYEIISEGVIGTTEKKKIIRPYYVAQTKPKEGFLMTDSIVYCPSLAFDPATSKLTGNIDNAAGVAISLASIEALCKIAQSRGVRLEDFNVKWVFPDEEEGLPDDPAYFAREARRIIHRASRSQLPQVIINIDGHDMIGGADPKSPAVYASIVSSGKGPIIPSDVHVEFDRFLQGLRPYNVETQKTEDVPANVSRSDDAAYMERHGEVMPIGYLVRDPHHNKGLPTANLSGLVNAAKAMAWIAAEMNI